VPHLSPSLPSSLSLRLGPTPRASPPIDASLPCSAPASPAPPTRYYAQVSAGAGALPPPRHMSHPARPPPPSSVWHRPHHPLLHPYLHAVPPSRPSPLHLPPSRGRARMVPPPFSFFFSAESNRTTMAAVLAFSKPRAIATLVLQPPLLSSFAASHRVADPSRAPTPPRAPTDGISR
jgi:hypothetical protein